MGNRHNKQKNDTNYSFDDNDIENTKKFREISRINAQQSISNNIDSSHLLELNPLQRVYIEHFKCSISKCEHLKRLIVVLTKYHRFIYQITQHEKEPNMPSIKTKNNEMYNDDLNVASTINDFHHVLDIHQHQFDELYNIFISQCNDEKTCMLSNCLMFRRNNRDRTALSTNNIQLKQTYFNCDSTNDMVNQQILDIIHCYYFHSIDIGYTLSKNDKIQIQQDINECKQHDEKSDNYCYDRITRRIFNNVDSVRFNSGNSTKFVASLTDSNAELKYSYGVKYFYWDYYKNNDKCVDPATHSTVYDLYPK
eukprot:24271_1